MIVLLCALLVGVALAGGSGGLSSMSADRGIQGQVAEDENAYLGFETATENTADGTTDLNVTVTNQFPSDATLQDVTVTVNGTTKELTAAGPLSPGESATVTFEGVPCGGDLTVDARGSGVGVVLDRTVAC